MSSQEIIIDYEAISYEIETKEFLKYLPTYIKN
jgi:hypothetical protein